VARYAKVFRSEKPFLKGAQAVIEAMLQSPNFIFWMEQTSQSEDGKATPRHPSFLISSGTPRLTMPAGCGGAGRVRTR
jgi:hypothetical protein